MSFVLLLTSAPSGAIALSSPCVASRSKMQASYTYDIGPRCPTPGIYKMLGAQWVCQLRRGSSVEFMDCKAVGTLVYTWFPTMRLRSQRDNGWPIIDGDVKLSTSSQKPCSPRESSF